MKKWPLVWLQSHKFNLSWVTSCRLLNWCRKQPSSERSCLDLTIPPSARTTLDCQATTWVVDSSLRHLSTFTRHFQSCRYRWESITLRLPISTSTWEWCIKMPRKMMQPWMPTRCTWSSTNTCTGKSIWIRPVVYSIWLGSSAGLKTSGRLLTSSKSLTRSWSNCLERKTSTSNCPSLIWTNTCRHQWLLRRTRLSLASRMPM